ncbi:GNAT family N-acetyltransferase [Streptomyces sp. NPDC056411]|uniref:GNAT family N-acetyltransferase n=1 Tax=Streptomyces sp. NPDC056411 TaxID=3345813 RepID=UPI0035D9D6D8
MKADMITDVPGRTGGTPLASATTTATIPATTPATTPAATSASAATAPVADLVEAWAVGWALSRHRPRPAEHPWGRYIDVGAPHEVGRHVLPYADGAAVGRATASVTVPRTWLKAPMPSEDLARWLPADWVVDLEDAGHLMTTDLRPTHPLPPADYVTSVEARDGVAFVEVHDAQGELAAQGQVALLGRSAVVDCVITQEAHRRRGLGSLVMRTLADRAVAEGARLGILGATDEGRALYETLGWQVRAPLAACTYLP